MSIVPTKQNKIKQITDIGSERAVLAGICQYGKDAFLDVNDICNVDTFTLESNKALYKTLVDILNETDKIDVTSVIAKAESNNLTSLICKEKTDIEYLRSLFSFPLLLENVRLHAKRLAKLEIARKAQQKHIEAYKNLQNITGSESIDEILRISEEPIFSLVDTLSQNRENNPSLIGKTSTEYLVDLQNNPCDNIGLPTPFPIFNKVIGGGLRPGYVDLILTRPKGYKSTTGINCALHLSNLKIPILYLDTEMDSKSQLGRIFANLTQIDINTLETGRFSTNLTHINTLNDANQHIQELSLFHHSIAGCQFEEILNIIRRWVLKELGLVHKPALIIYDYFKLMDPAILQSMQEFQAIGFQIGKLTDFCKEYNLSCLAFGQLNRTGIDKDTSDIISQSDRLLWLAASASFLRRKTTEEIFQDGIENGNLKLKTIECRFGSGLEDNNHINLQVIGDTFTLKEINTNYDVKRKQNTITEKTADIVDF